MGKRDKGKGGQGDKEKEIPYPLVPPSPCPLVSLLALPTPDNFPQEDLWDWICENSKT
jgi:hypothetical protein